MAVSETTLPSFLSHYYEQDRGPFLNLSHLPPNQAEKIQQKIRRTGKVFASQRPADYLHIRRQLEEQVRRQFLAKGGKPRLARPHYMTLGSCPWIKDWYVNGQVLCLPLSTFGPDIVSFTYGDTFPAMRLDDGRPYRGQVYTLTELPEVVRRYGLPQNWNPDGHQGPDRYIEAQIWDETPLQPYLPNAGPNACQRL